MMILNPLTVASASVFTRWVLAAVRAPPAQPYATKDTASLGQARAQNTSNTSNTSNTRAACMMHRIIRLDRDMDMDMGIGTSAHVERTSMAMGMKMGMHMGMVEK